MLNFKIYFFKGLEDLEAESMGGRKGKDYLSPLVNIDNSRVRVNANVYDHYRNAALAKHPLRLS